MYCNPNTITSTTTISFNRTMIPLKGADADDQQRAQPRHQYRRRKIDDRAAETQRVVRRHVNGRSRKRGRKMDAHILHKPAEISPPADRHGGSRSEIFE